MMEWAGQDSATPYKVDYHCDGNDEQPDIGCAYKGTYDWHKAQWDEYSPEDYAISENWSVSDVLDRFIELGGTIHSSDPEEENNT